jgi:hypothetical protein
MIIKLNNPKCEKCPFKLLEIIAINPVIKSCKQCNKG